MAKRKAPKQKDFKFTRECPVCPKRFKTNRATKIYCSQSCQFRSWSEKNPRSGKLETTLDVLLEVNKWFEEAKGPEHNAYYEVKGKLTEALQEATRAIDQAGK
jgi:hypothetical protein